MASRSRADLKTAVESASSESESSETEREVTTVGSERTADESFLDEMIVRLMTAGMKPHPGNGTKRNFSPTINVTITIEEVDRVTKLAIASFSAQKTLLRISRELLPITICGDIHGQIRDLRVVLNKCGDPSNTNYLFLGDYVDRGTEGLETIVLLLCLKIRYPNKVFLLRGNHEDASITVCYGFFDECLKKYGKLGHSIWKMFTTTFTYMPIAALIDGKVFCAHGGLSPYLENFEQIEELRRPSVVPPYGLFCDLLWSDPDSRFKGYANSPRGISFTFGEKVVHDFCKKHGVQMIVRGHQIDRDMTTGGYRSFANGKLMTIFTACNYLNMRNDGCTMTISPELKVTFNVFRPTKIRQRRAVYQQQEV
ncbi:hypothetical protein QR680_011174 [Steinernema hermaphroditum]|uniref:Serine/threonine-protein phosphatase n=1 Tax=Steinernema hermaphroditum TaxID=289476 RepID=A0AA39MCE2_9BILA|nr:hypothetical protein QR680_011174 [Steinernema hermaphroditum]